MVAPITGGELNGHSDDSNRQTFNVELLGSQVHDNRLIVAILRKKLDFVFILALREPLYGHFTIDPCDDNLLIFSGGLLVHR